MWEQLLGIGVKSQVNDCPAQISDFQLFKEVVDSSGYENLV